jgi:hypothetical protein
MYRRVSEGFTRNKRELRGSVTSNLSPNYHARCVRVPPSHPDHECDIVICDNSFHSAVVLEYITVLEIFAWGCYIHVFFLSS